MSGILAAASVALLSSFASARADNAGELLIGGLNCTACHFAPDSAMERLCAGRAPKLGTSGSAMTPQWISAFLDNPQMVKPGTSMPDMLGNLTGTERAAAVEALTHYLLSVKSNTLTTVEATPADIKRGGELFHQIGCVACHAPTEPPPGRTSDAATTAEIAKLAAESVPFPDIERKYAVPDLADFLRSPVKAHPAGTMPSFRLDKDGARQVSMWILRGQVKSGGAPARGLVCDYFDRPFGDLSMFENAVPTKSSVVDDISTEPAPHNDEFALRFRSRIIIPRDGEYTFYTSSDDGSWLLIDGKLVVNNGGYHADFEASGKITLTAGDHSIVVCFFQGTGESALSAGWEGPGIPKEKIPKSAFTRPDLDMKPTGAVPFEFDETKADAGRRLFVSLNCAICHPQPGESGVTATASLADLAGRDGGCLDPSPANGLPRYAIHDAGRTAIKTALVGAKSFVRPLAPAAQLHRNMTALNCYACHSRAGQGGPQGFRREYFLTNDGKNTDDAKRFPPSLDDLGKRHDADWIKRALEEPASSERMTRMPVCGDAAGLLPELFIKADAGAR